MCVITAGLNFISHLQYVAYGALTYITVVYRYSVPPDPVLLHLVPIRVRLDTSATPSANTSSIPDVLLATTTGHTSRHS